MLFRWVLIWERSCGFCLKIWIFKFWSEVLRKRVENLTYQVKIWCSSMILSGFSAIFRNDFVAFSTTAPIIRKPWNFCERFLRASSENQSIISLRQDKGCKGSKIWEVIMIFGWKVSKSCSYLVVWMKSIAKICILAWTFIAVWWDECTVFS